MTEALFRIPSRTVQYGYVEISVEGDFGLSPEALAAHYVNFIYAFQKEEEATVQRLKDAPSGALKAPLAASEPTPEEVAKQAIIEGLGPVTELPEADVAVVDEPGDPLGRHLEVKADGTAPWEAKVDAPKKPWEAEVTAPAVIDAAW